MNACSVSLGLKAIAESAHRLDQRVVAGRRQALAKPADVDVNRTFFDECVVAPDFIEEFGAAEDAAGVRHEEMQQTEFGGPQIDFAAAGSNAPRRGIQLKACDLDHVVGELRRAPAHHRLDACKQLAPGIRFGYVIVRSALQRRHLVLLFRTLADQDNGDVPGTLIAAQPARKRETWNARQYPIEQNQVGPDLAHQRLGLCDVAGATHLVSGILKIGRKHLPSGYLVFDYQDGTVHSASLFMFDRSSEARAANPLQQARNSCSPSLFQLVRSTYAW